MELPLEVEAQCIPDTRGKTKPNELKGFDPPGISVPTFKQEHMKYYKTKPNCKICNHPHRVKIEEVYYRANDFKVTHSYCEYYNLKVSYVNIRNHFGYGNGSQPHVDFKQAAVESSAKRFLELIKTKSDDLVTSQQILEVIIQKGFDTLDSHEVKPETTIKAVKTKHEISGANPLNKLRDAWAEKMHLQNMEDQAIDVDHEVIEE